jgi:hypothetical protein
VLRRRYHAPSTSTLTDVVAVELIQTDVH